MKGKLVAMDVWMHKGQAQEQAAHARECGYSARIYERMVRADGEFTFVWCVVAREKKSGA